MKTEKINKAVTDSIVSLLQDGINVNVRIETATYVKLLFFAILVVGIIGATNYGLHILKK